MRLSIFVRAASLAVPVTKAKVGSTTGLIQVVADALEGRGQLTTKSIDNQDNRDGNAGGNKAILDGGGA